MNDDFNSPIVIANLFEGVRVINSAFNKQESLTKEDIITLKEIFDTFITDVLGLKNEQGGAESSEKLEGLMHLVIELRKNARANKDFATSDKIRDELMNIGISLKDTREGTTWEINN
jgi:cysteinyl-tRNA synthetase